MLIRVLLVVSKIVREDSSRTLGYGRWCEFGRRTVYPERLFALEDFFFFSLYSFSWIARQVMTLTKQWLISSLDFLETNSNHLLSWFWIPHSSYHYHISMRVHVTPEQVILFRTWCRLWLHPSPGRNYCSEPCSVSRWVYLTSKQLWVHVWTNCINQLLRLSWCGMCQYPPRSP